MKRLLAWLDRKPSPQPKPYAMGKPPVLVPNDDDDFTLGTRAERLIQPQTWADVRAFCSNQAEQEILTAKDDLASAAAAAHRAQALLNLPLAIHNAAQTAELRRAKQVLDQQEQEIEKKKEASISRRWSGRFA